MIPHIVIAGVAGVAYLLYRGHKAEQQAEEERFLAELEHEAVWKRQKKKAKKKLKKTEKKIRFAALTGDFEGIEMAVATAQTVHTQVSDECNGLAQDIRALKTRRDELSEYRNSPICTNRLRSKIDRELNALLPTLAELKRRRRAARAKRKEVANELEELLNRREAIAATIRDHCDWRGRDFF